MAIMYVTDLSEVENNHRFDAEFYQPKYSVLLKRLNVIRCDTKPLRQISQRVDVGFVSSMQDQFVDKGIPLLRTQNVTELGLDLDAGLVFIPYEFHKKLRKTRIFPGFVLLARSGSIGDACVVPHDFPEANSADIISIEPKTPVNSEYLATFLNCKYGKGQIFRFVSGGLQRHINITNLEKIRVPLLSSEHQTEIKNLIKKSYSEISKSKEYCSAAENLLLSKLGLQDLEPRYDLSYTANLSEAFIAHRVDAEYFQPAYDEIIGYLNTNFELRPLRKFLLDLKKGIEVGSGNYEEESKPFRRVSNLSTNGFVKRDQKYISEELYCQLKNDYEPKVGELLLTKDATPGIAYALKEPTEGIISSGILRLKINENEINTEYLALYINSIIGRLQIERDSGGSVIKHWKLEQIKRLQIPIVPQEPQQRIASLIQQSHEARKRAKELLKEAKRKVEEAIEKA